MLWKPEGETKEKEETLFKQKLLEPAGEQAATLTANVCKSE